MIRTSPLTVTELLKQFKVIRPQVKSVVYNQFHIPLDFRLCMKYYRLKYMTGHQFDAYRTADGMLRSGNPSIHETFNIIYQGCNPVAVRKAAQVRVSFRIAEESFNIEPVVIVRITNDSIPVDSNSNLDDGE